MGKTSIEWTDASWNPIVGCTEISPGCANCYAARLAATRLRYTPAYKGLAGKFKSEIQFPAVYPHGIPEGTIQPRWTAEVRFLPERLDEPLHWRKPRRIFVCDMGDLFHEDVKDKWIEEVIDIIVRSPHHTFQILTKRAQRMHDWFDREWRIHGVYAKPLPNVWLGVSVENQHFADERIPLLLTTPAAVRWISAEPLLGPVSLVRAGLGPWLNWVVAGGESGPHARPMHPDWARSLRDQCQTAGVPFFFKQWGNWSSHTRPDEDFIKKCRSAVNWKEWPDGTWMHEWGKKLAGRLLDGREWNEYPCAR